MVEIMIVVAIIGLLAAITIPNLVNARMQSRRNICINNLRLIAAAKDEAAINLLLDETVVPTTTQLSPYFRNVQLINGLPKEPDSGVYTINAVSTDPACSVGGAHVL